MEEVWYYYQAEDFLRLEAWRCLIEAAHFTTTTKKREWSVVIQKVIPASPQILTFLWYPFSHSRVI